jgi:hypothetical protein
VHFIARMREKTMFAIIGWSLAAVLGLLLVILQWSWKRHSSESFVQSEFIAVVFMDTGIYETTGKYTSIGWKNF